MEETPDATQMGLATSAPAGSETADAPPILELTLIHTEIRLTLTRPQPRYRESDLIGALQRGGLGRPSTYATTLGLLCERQLARRSPDGELRPTWQGMAIWALLGDTGLIGPERQAAFEAALDQVQRGERRRIDVLGELWRAPGGVLSMHAELRRRPPTPIHLPALDGTGMHVIVTPAGVFVVEGKHSAALPECEPHELTADLARQTLQRPEAVSLRNAREVRSRRIKAAQEPRLIGLHPEWNTPLTLKTSGKGRYLHGHDGQREWMSFVPATEDASTLSPQRAALLLNLNRELGLAHGLSGHEGQSVRTGLGRYGPYVRCGSRHRAISENQAMTLDLEEALTLLREPPRPGSATMSTHARLRRDGARRGSGGSQI